MTVDRTAAQCVCFVGYGRVGCKGRIDVQHLHEDQTTICAGAGTPACRKAQVASRLDSQKDTPLQAATAATDSGGVSASGGAAQSIAFSMKRYRLRGKQSVVSTKRLRPSVPLLQVLPFWAEAILSGKKVWEIRAQRTRHRGKIHICATDGSMKKSLGEARVDDCLEVGRYDAVHGRYVPWSAAREQREN